jgi:hypothetical protein
LGIQSVGDRRSASRVLRGRACRPRAGPYGRRILHSYRSGTAASRHPRIGIRSLTAINNAAELANVLGRRRTPSIPRWRVDAERRSHARPRLLGKDVTAMPTRHEWSDDGQMCRNWLIQVPRRRSASRSALHEKGEVSRLQSTPQSGTSLKKPSTHLVLTFLPLGSGNSSRGGLHASAIAELTSFGHLRCRVAANGAMSGFSV